MFHNCGSTNHPFISSSRTISSVVHHALFLLFHSAWVPSHRLPLSVFCGSPASTFLRPSVDSTSRLSLPRPRCRVYDPHNLNCFCSCVGLPIHPLHFRFVARLCISCLHIGTQPDSGHHLPVGGHSVALYTRGAFLHAPLFWTHAWMNPRRSAR